ncbi:MAG: exodeoxyribonuclease VII large subunit [Caldilineaceae bacterium]
MTNPLTISALSTHITMLFEQDELLRDLWVTGEVSNWKRAASGHIYFSLKDSGASIAAVMWRNSAIAHSWLPGEGDQILAHGYVGLYPERGSYQLYVNQIRPAGRGQLYAQFEALKAQLEAEGLFASERKRPIPTAVRRIGIVTSADAAALRDILRVLSARWPLVEVIVFSTLVQGAEAPAQIVNAIKTANQYSQACEPLDVLIVARGGGSIEDLWAFNDPKVAYAIAQSELPIVCGVGHETDFTIADFVADLRAPTPSAAAAAVVPDRNDRFAQLAAVTEQLSNRALQRLEDERWQLQQAQNRLGRLHPQRQIDQQRQRLDDRQRRLELAIRTRLDRATASLTAANVWLNALNPTNVLKRGYSIIQTEAGTVVTRPDQAAAGDRLQVRSAGGEYQVQKM